MIELWSWRVSCLWMHWSRRRGCARVGPAAKECGGDGELPEDDGVDGAAFDRTRGQAGIEGEEESDYGDQAECSDDDADEADQPRLGSLSPVDAQDEGKDVPADDRQRCSGEVQGKRAVLLRLEEPWKVPTRM
ncbi:hypothetical protein NKG94_37035 [Micromonospora sp. M12]